MTEASTSASWFHRMSSPIRKELEKARVFSSLADLDLANACHQLELAAYTGSASLLLHSGDITSRVSCLKELILRVVSSRWLWMMRSRILRSG